MNYIISFWNLKLNQVSSCFKPLQIPFIKTKLHFPCQVKRRYNHCLKRPLVQSLDLQGISGRNYHKSTPSSRPLEPIITFESICLSNFFFLRASNSWKPSIYIKKEEEKTYQREICITTKTMVQDSKDISRSSTGNHNLPVGTDPLKLDCHGVRYSAEICSLSIDSEVSVQQYPKKFNCSLWYALQYDIILKIYDIKQIICVIKALDTKKNVSR